MEILKIELLTHHLNETERFYHHLLGLSIAEKNSTLVSFVAGTSMLTFIQTDQKQPAYHFAFTIPCNKLEEAIVWFSSKTELIKITNTDVLAYFDSWNAKAFYFYDNNGNILECIARFDLNNNKTEPFNSSSLLSISEIGIVTNNVKLLSGSLSERYKLFPFAKQQPLDNFAASGDDNGLLILSAINRNWFPTDVPAEKFMTKIKIKNGEEIHEVVFNQ